MLDSQKCSVGKDKLVFRVNIGNVKEGEKWTYVLINLITKIEPKIFLTYVATLMFLFKSDLLIRLAIMKRHSGFITSPLLAVDSSGNCCWIAFCITSFWGLNLTDQVRYSLVWDGSYMFTQFLKI